MNRYEARKMLTEWGQASDKLKWNEKNIQKELAFEKSIEARKNEFDLETYKMLLENCRKNIVKLQEEKEKIIRNKVMVDEFVRTLSLEEQKLLQMRYEKGYTFDYITMKMYRSRATLFRMQAKIFEKLVEEFENKEGAWKCG